MFAPSDRPPTEGAEGAEGAEGPEGRTAEGPATEGLAAEGLAAAGLAADGLTAAGLTAGLAAEGRRRDGLAARGAAVEGPASSAGPPLPASGDCPFVGAFAFMMRSAAAGVTSARSSFPLASASTRRSRGTARSTSLSSLAGSPHHRGLRTSVSVSCAASRSPTRKGPAASLRSLRAESLKPAGLPMTDFG